MRDTLHEIRSRNCNIFTIVGRREALIVKREAQEVYFILTCWIIKAFLSFVPKMEGARMGAAFSGRGIEPIQPLPLDNFSPTSEIYSPFLSLPTPLESGAIYYLLLSTASSPNALHIATETPFTVQPKRPSYRHRNALHSATETPFLFLQKCTVHSKQ
jgi:hypothetical protein